MGKKRFETCGLLVALALAWQPAQAGDRKSAGQMQESAKAILLPSPAREVASPAGRPTATVGIFENGYAVSHRREVSTAKENEPKREHRPLTLFHFNSKFGEVAVQPVIGKVNGAQFSVGF